MKFDNIRKALEYTVENLVSKQHSYIVSVRGPKEIHYNRASCFQVVAQTMSYRDCQAGLTLHLSFDPANGVTDELLCFLEWPLRYFFDRHVWSSIPCFTLRMGEDVSLAERVSMLLLTDVYGYTTGTDFECDVSDEGPINTEEDDDEDQDEGGFEGEDEDEGVLDEEAVKLKSNELENGQLKHLEIDRLASNGTESGGKGRAEGQEAGQTSSPRGEN